MTDTQSARDTRRTIRMDDELWEATKERTWEIRQSVNRAIGALLTLFTKLPPKYSEALLGIDAMAQADLDRLQRALDAYSMGGELHFDHGPKLPVTVNNPSAAESPKSPESPNADLFECFRKLQGMKSAQAGKITTPLLQEFTQTRAYKAWEAKHAAE